MRSRTSNVSGKNMNGKSLKRLLKLFFKSNPWLVSLILLFLLINAIISSMPALFSQRIIQIIELNWQQGDWAAVSGQVFSLVSILFILYLISITVGIVYQQLLVYVSQTFMKKLRIQLFSLMQKLPIQFFDTHAHGDIMSHYTNDIDSMVQMLQQAVPALFSSLIVAISVFSIMLYFSLWLTIVVVIGVSLMLLIIKKIGSKSGKYYGKQQVAIGKLEGYVEEMMHGQKVVKVFNHQEASTNDFEKLNSQLFEDAQQANKFSNMMMPILMNIGNILYVFIALVGSLMLIFQVPNVSFSGLAFQISVFVPFLDMTRQFSGNLSNASMQINYIAMASAGANRVFELLDMEPEIDQGTITLVNCELSDGQLVETDVVTNIFAWKKVGLNGETKLTLLEGDVRLNHVNFGYVKDQLVLKDMTLYAYPGQKVAFVGATGAGKTTITNLINRFYEVEEGQIHYDGIDITEIKKADLRKSMGMVLQDSHLFTGTVMENIRYGRLQATDQECIEAAKLSGADYFIRLLPEGYQTVISGNNESLSQGQRQLLTIARAQVAKAPVMILDEATSSIDTRTEAMVSKGMDELMNGRTVFVIAHRLSTVKNSDVIMVLEQGEIIERGNHDMLMNQKGKYYQLYMGGLETD